MNNEKFINELKRIGVNADRAIERFMGNEELFVSFMLRFPQNIDFVEIRKCLEEKNEEQFYFQVHNLKGVSGNLEIEKLSEYAQEILTELKNSKFSQMEKLITLVNKAESEYEKITAALLPYKREER